jgi:HNH endonuclease
MGLIPKHWAEFQHYKNRSPRWIKLHHKLLDDFAFSRLPLASKALAPMLWLLASEYDDGNITAPMEEIAFRLRVTDEELRAALIPLIDEGFFNDGLPAKPAERGATLAQRTAKSNGFGSRYISDEVKRAVWVRDNGKCRSCGSDENIEYDHIHPVSKGGNSEIDNIQLLCRPCNRAKRTRLQELLRLAQPLAEQAQQTSSPEKRRGELELESDIRAVATATRTDGGQDFEEFWKTYPKRAGANPKTPARQKFLAAVKSGVPSAEITQAARQYANEQRQLGKIGTEHVAMASTWLNQKRWGDYPATAPPSAKPAYLTPPPGCEPLEVILEKVEKPNATEERKKIRGHSSVGTNRSN